MIGGVTGGVGGGEVGVRGRELCGEGMRERSLLRRAWARGYGGVGVRGEGRKALRCLGLRGEALGGEVAGGWEVSGGWMGGLRVVCLGVAIGWRMMEGGDMGMGA